jgi:nucleoside-diphosphate-sugar epimerase
MKIIITGHTGHVGSSLLYKLIKKELPKHEQHQILCISSGSNYSNESKDILYKAKSLADESDNIKVFYVMANLANREELLNRIPMSFYSGADVLFHQASIISVPYSMKFPSHSYNNNTNACMNVLDVFGSYGLKKAIIALSCAVYGGDYDQNTLQKESDVLQYQRSPYSASKLAEEEIALCMPKVYKDMNTVVLRYYDIYGPRQRYLGTYTPVIRKFLQEIHVNKKIYVHGTGKQERMFTYISDIVNANILTMNMDTSKYGTMYNISSGSFGMSNILNVIELIKKYYTTDFEAIVTGEVRPGDGNRMAGDISKAKACMGFEPQTTFEEGMKKMCDWFAKYINPWVESPNKKNK